LNILVITSSNSSFNILRPELEIYLGLAQRGHTLTIITHGDSKYAQLFRDANIKVIDGHPKKKFSFKTIKLIRQLIEQQNFDIVYATDSKSIPNAAFAAIGTGVKLVAYRGTISGLYRHDPTSYLTALNPRIDGIICVSESVRQHVMSKLWKNKNKAVTIHKGHDLAWYEINPADLTEFGISKNDFTVICAVNARPSKGLDIMLKATQQLSDINNLQLLLVGKNIDTEPYTNLINSSPMKSRIHVLGFRKDAPALIAASKVLVQPSISGEGLPRAVMEALGCGVVPIVTTTGGGKEVVENNMNGFIVPVKDSQAIADRVRQLSNDSELYFKMSVACKESLRSTFSSQATIDKVEKYFESLGA
jgi:L-malate glycosyltransferase